MWREAMRFDPATEIRTCCFINRTDRLQMAFSMTDVVKMASFMVSLVTMAIPMTSLVMLRHTGCVREALGRNAAVYIGYRGISWW